MDFDLNRAIWAQLLDEWVRRIVTGQWPVGGRVPAVRELAAELGVNPNTVQRSLAELDATGLAGSQRTSGRFVTQDAALINQRRRDLAAGAARHYVAAAHDLQLTRTTAHELLDELWDHSGEETSS